MLRSILGVIAAYVVIFIILFCVLTGAYFAMGPDRAFEPGSYTPSVLWDVIEIVVGLGAAVAAGALCIAITRKRGAVTALAVVILVLGLLSAIPAFMAAGGPAEVRTGSVSNLEAMMKAKPPAWMALLNPVIGIAGVLVGGRMKRT